MTLDAGIRRIDVIETRWIHDVRNGRLFHKFVPWAVALFAAGVPLDPRLTPPGTFLEREYRGLQIIVKILVNAFEFDRRDLPVPKCNCPRGGWNEVE